MVEVVVATKRREAEDIFTFELVAKGGGALPAFSAGSHVDVQVPGGLVRQYSLCNDPTENHRYLIGVLRTPDSRGGSRAMHEIVTEGDTIEISSPRNHFALAHDGKHSILIAGGIGITPILCMAERLNIIGASFVLHYSTRSRSRTAFLKHIEESSFADKAQFHFDDGDAAQKLNLESVLETPAEHTHVYVCGPKGLVDAAMLVARSKGWPEQLLHYELFASDPTKQDTDTAFSVTLASSGRVVRVAKDQTVVAALAAVGVNVPTSCEQGVCGTCLTRVISGEPEHRDMYLTSDEHAANNLFLPCCSRAKSDLVLDL